MKAKRNAFVNSSTGYGRRKHHLNYNQTKRESNSTNLRSEAKHKKADNEKKPELDQNLNSGFGDYLRTTEAFKMMKLFVFANTIMLMVTMAWPLIKEQLYMLHQWWENFHAEEA